MEIPTYLIVLFTIFAIAGIISFLYVIFAFRRISIASKKIDYLIEDLTYKSEKLNPTIDAVVKVSTYLELIETLYKKNSNDFTNFIKSNKENAISIKNQINETIIE